MRLYVEPEVWRSKSGWLARAPSLKLCAYGVTKEEAVKELIAGIERWCRTMRNEGILAEGLKRARLTSDGHEGPVEVEMKEPAFQES